MGAQPLVESASRTGPASRRGDEAPDQGVGGTASWPRGRWRGRGGWRRDCRRGGDLLVKKRPRCLHRADGTVERLRVPGSPVAARAAESRGSPGWWPPAAGAVRTAGSHAESRRWFVPVPLFGRADPAAARVGLHNDCFLGSTTTRAPYGDGADKTFLASDSKYVVVGGEPCGTP